MSAMRTARGTLKNCKACGKVFVVVHTEDYCQACLPEAEEKERKLREFMFEHQGETTIDIVREVKAMKSEVDNHAAEDVMAERDILESHHVRKNVCASCGKPIAEGRTYCPDCFQSWMHTIKSRSVLALTPALPTHAPGDPDRAAPIDVAMLNRIAASSVGRPNRPHGPGQSSADVDERKAQRYSGIIDPRRIRRR